MNYVHDNEMNHLKEQSQKHVHGNFLQTESDDVAQSDQGENTSPGDLAFLKSYKSLQRLATIKRPVWQHDLGDASGRPQLTSKQENILQNWEHQTPETTD